MWLLAFDAGGSHTRAALHHADADGEQTFLGRAGPGNLRSLGTAGVLANLLSAFELAAAAAAESALREKPRPPQTDLAALVCCLAGASAGVSELRQELLRCFAVEADDLHVLPDYEALLGAAPPKEPRLALIAGTGSIAVAIDAQGQRWRSGGRGVTPGPKGAGDPGSAHWLVQQIAARAGLGLPPGASPAEIAGRLPELLAKPPLSPNELETLTEAAASALAEPLERVQQAAQLGAEFPLYLGGGLLLHSAPLRSALEARWRSRGWRPDVQLVSEPWRGALGLAWLAALGMLDEPRVTSV